MFCTKCGTQINDNVAICPNCGCPTGAQQEVQYQPQSTQQHQQTQYQESAPQQSMTVEQASQKVEKTVLQ